MTNCKRYTEQELQQLLSVGIAELQRENAELQKDKARLDWLADANQSIGMVMLPRHIVEKNLDGLRHGIDMAMGIDNLKRGKQA